MNEVTMDESTRNQYVPRFLKFYGEKSDTEKLRWLGYFTSRSDAKRHVRVKKFEKLFVEMKRDEDE